jgi:hypothetical protein
MLLIYTGSHVYVRTVTDRDRIGLHSTYSIQIPTQYTDDDDE